jgi:asparagine synthase (glutamine-hydrolysing)
MCGIVGSVGLLPSAGAAARALANLRPRGPDGAGEWRGGDVWLGHRRLAIIETGAAGAQPMVHPDRPDVVVTYNGEIYNYRALRTELAGKGVRFRTMSDTELLLHAYTAWGEALLDRIEGMFAFAIYDGKLGQLLLARDPVGQKPLYLRSVDGALTFASTSTALRCLDSAVDRLSPTALCYVLTLGYVPAPHSIWSGVEALKPGHYVVWRADQPLRYRRYWSPPEAVGQERDPEEFPELFAAVCAEHTISDVPIGLYLSGGLDSTSVALALASAGEPTECYSLGFAGHADSELAIAGESAKALALPWTSLEVGYTDVDELRRSVADSVDEPQTFSALLTMYAIAELAARQRKVMISGDGGDELFGGYGWYRSRPNRVANWVRSLVRGGSARKTDDFAARSLLHAHAMGVHRRFLPDESGALFGLNPGAFTEETMLAPLAEYYVPSLPCQNAMQRIDLMTFCSGSILAKVDRMAMAHSLEVRVPFLDRRVIAWALSQPTPPTVAGNEKPVLRRMLRGNVPESVFTHPKQGFSMRGLESYDYGRLLQEIGRSRLVAGGVLSGDFAAWLDSRTSFGKARIWALAAVATWYEHQAVPHPA